MPGRNDFLGHIVFGTKRWRRRLLLCSALILASIVPAAVLLGSWLQQRMGRCHGRDSLLHAVFDSVSSSSRHQQQVCSAILIGEWRSAEYAYSLSLRRNYSARARAEALLANDTLRAGAFLSSASSLAPAPAANAEEEGGGGGSATVAALEDAKAAAERLVAANQTRMAVALPAECLVVVGGFPQLAEAEEAEAGGGGAAAASPDSRHFLQHPSALSSAAASLHPFAAIPPPPTLRSVSFLLQYFRRPDVVADLVSSLAACVATNHANSSGGRGESSLPPASSFSAELLVNVDSDEEATWAAWRAARERHPGFISALLFSNNIHELHGYNRLAAMARGELLVLLQDDELPPAEGACELLANATRFFQLRPRLGLLSLRGGDQWVGHWYGFEGPSAPPDAEDAKLLRRLKAKGGFQFVTAGYPSPLLVRRSAFMQARPQAPSHSTSSIMIRRCKASAVVLHGSLCSSREAPAFIRARQEEMLLQHRSVAGAGPRPERASSS